MDTKLNHSDLSALLAKDNSLSQSKSELFTKTFFDIIIEGLEKDGIVKINGLGTFRMVDVASRSSVNVNTGEKFEIKGHKKLSFTPADSLKEKVNQPFAMFEPVEVNDDYVDEDTENRETITEDVEVEPINETPEVEQTTQTTEIEDENVTSAPVTEIENKEVDDTISPQEEEQDEEQSIESVKDSNIAEPESTPIVEKEIKTVTNNSLRKYRVWGFYLLLTLLIVGTYIYVYKYNIEKPATDVVAVVKPEKQIKNIVEKKQTVTNEKKVTADTIQNNKTVEEVKTTVKVEPTGNEQFFITKELESLPLANITLKDTTMYECVGNIAIHKVGANETLTKISLKYFKDKKLWPYIVKHNNMQNHNQLEIGMELAIPRLIPKK